MAPRIPSGSACAPAGCAASSSRCFRFVPAGCGALATGFGACAAGFAFALPKAFPIGFGARAAAAGGRP
eukprot:3123907-Prymnesium_polylepis.1